MCALVEGGGEGPVPTPEDGCDCDMRKFGSFDHGTCKTVLNLLETICLCLRKTVLARVTVVQFRVNNKGNEG